MRRPRHLFLWMTALVTAALGAAIVLAPPPADALLIPEVEPHVADGLVADATTPLVLLFSVDGCRLCHVAHKILRPIAREHFGRVRFAVVDLEEAERLRTRYDLVGAPTTLVFDQGRLVHRTSALETSAELDAALRQR